MRKLGYSNFLRNGDNCDIRRLLAIRKVVWFTRFCSVKGYRGLVERYLEVEVSGFGRDGSPIKFDACGWKARILQHEYDHIEGLLFVDKMVPRTFRTTANLQLVLPSGCPKLGVYEASTNL